MALRIESLPEYVHVSWHGELVSQDLTQLSHELPKLGLQLGKAPNVLHTFDEVRGMGLAARALEAHGRHLAQIKLPNPSRSASVCHNPLAFGMARMMQLYNQNPDLQIEVFSDEVEAVDWLRGGPKSAGPSGLAKS